MASSVAMGTIRRPRLGRILQIPKYYVWNRGGNWSGKCRKNVPKGENKQLACSLWNVFSIKNGINDQMECVIYEKYSSLHVYIQSSSPALSSFSFALEYFASFKSPVSAEWSEQHTSLLPADIIFAAVWKFSQMCLSAVAFHLYLLLGNHLILLGCCCF